MLSTYIYLYAKLNFVAPDASLDRINAPGRVSKGCTAFGSNDESLDCLMPEIEHGALSVCLQWLVGIPVAVEM